MADTYILSFMYDLRRLGMGQMMTIPPRLNILQIISDQHLADALGCAGHRQAITPNMDRLAASGIRFTRAYTQNPICTPSRVSILSGQYCHNHGYYGLSGPTPTRLPSFLGHFRQHGYRTAAIGKLHLPNDPHDWAADHVDLYLDCQNNHRHGNEFGMFHQYLEGRGLLAQEDSARLSELPGRQQQTSARPSHLLWDDCIEGWTVNRCIDFLNDCGDQPWALQCSFYRPHQCYTPDRRFWEMYDEDLDLPETFGDDVSHRPPHFRQTVERYRLNEKTAKLIWRGYLACITHVDHGLGLMLDHLKATGQLDRTVIVYHSDHGAYSTQYGLAEKAPGICSEQVCRVPFIWSAPCVTSPGSTSNQLVENIDLGPTFASLAGLPPMDWVDGRDISPLLAGGNEPVRQVAVTEHPWSKCIRFGSYRYVHYPRAMFDGKDVGELYNLDDDPLERQNLYNSPNHQSVLHEAQRRLIDWQIESTRAVTALGSLRRGDKHAADGKLPNDPEHPTRTRLADINYL